MGKRQLLLLKCESVPQLDSPLGDLSKELKFYVIRRPCKEPCALTLCSEIAAARGLQDWSHLNYFRNFQGPMMQYGW